MMSLIMLAQYSQAVKTSATGSVNAVYLLDRKVPKGSRNDSYYSAAVALEKPNYVLSLLKINERSKHAGCR